MVAKSDRYDAGRLLLGAALRERRSQASLTLTGLAAKADVSVGYISDVERGRRMPALDKLDMLAAALGTDVATLLQGVYPWGAALSPRSVSIVPDGREKAH